MDINTNNTSAQASTLVTGTPLLKKAAKLEGQTALMLVNSIQQPQQASAANLPPHLGQNINTTA
ncbi:MAG TPA: putative motility protein [Sideroxyarcus sp.]|nr:putative motility protein [Sideroxyarcus sp.]